MTFEEIQPKKSVSTIPEAKGERPGFSKEKLFEEEFTNLERSGKQKCIGIIYDKEGTSQWDGVNHKPNELCILPECFDFYLEEDIRMHCRGNQRIKEAIEAMVHGVAAPDEILIECQNYLYKELRLE